MSRSEKQARSDRNKLRAFAKELMEEWAEHFALDGGDIQELALKHGLLVEVEMTELCGELCECAEAGDFPQTCNRFSSILTGNQKDPRPSVKETT